jgi:hypothetical protein
VVEADGEIVGHSGVIPQRFCVLGREVVFSFATAFCVLPEYQFHGIRLAHEFLTHEQSTFPLTNSGNDATVAIYKFFGGLDIPGMADNDYIFSLRLDRLLYRRVARSARGIPLSLARLVMPLVKWIGPVLAYWIWERHRSPYVIEHCERVDEEFDRLWKDLSRSYSVLSVRSREYLTWRYFQHPERPYHLFATRGRDGNLAGYVVYWFGTQGSDLRILHIVDLFCDHANSNLVMALLQKMIGEARHLNADAVRIQNVPVPLKRLLKRKGFLRYRRNNRTVYRNNCKIPSEVLSSSAAWYCTTSDGDADIAMWPIAWDRG